MEMIKTGLVDQMGGEEKISFAERRIIGHIAKLELLVELGNAKLVQAVDSDNLSLHKDLAFLIGSCIRAMAVLGLDRLQRPPIPNLSDYLDKLDKQRDAKLKLVGSSS